MAKIFLRIIGVIVLLFLIILFVIPSIFYVWYLLTGKHIQRLSYSNAPTVAQTIVDKGWDAKECFNLKLNPFELIRYPTESQHQTGCVSQVAFLKKDPSACELLMPSDYAWDCLGSVENQLYKGITCVYNKGSDDVYCNQFYSEGEIELKNPQIENCSLYQRKDLREWCHLERTKRLEAYECSSISNEVMHDYCHLQYAIKRGGVEFCAASLKDDRRAFCEERVRMSTRYR